MSKKIVWLVVSCLMVAALVLASCSPAVTEEEKEEVHAVVIQFVEACVAKDIDAMAKLNTDPEKWRMTLDMLVMPGNYEQWFEGYQDIEVLSIDITIGVVLTPWWVGGKEGYEWRPTDMEGDTAVYEGKVIYAAGTEHPLAIIELTLHRLNGGWKIYGGPGFRSFP